MLGFRFSIFHFRESLQRKRNRFHTHTHTHTHERKYTQQTLRMHTYIHTRAHAHTHTHTQSSYAKTFPPHSYHYPLHSTTLYLPSPSLPHLLTVSHHHHWITTTQCNFQKSTNLGRQPKRTTSTNSCATFCITSLWAGNVSRIPSYNC